MVGLCGLLALGAVGFWQTRGSAASLEEGLRPVIAAAAAPFWSALPEVPRLPPKQPVRIVSVASTEEEKPPAFQTASIRGAAPSTSNAPLASTVVVPAALDAALDAALAEIAAATTTTAATTTATTAATTTAATTTTGATEDTAPSNEPAATIDPVSRRYGL
jgi:hypothetical protein